MSEQKRSTEELVELLAKLVKPLTVSVELPLTLSATLMRQLLKASMSCGHGIALTSDGQQLSPAECGADVLAACMLSQDITVEQIAAAVLRVQSYVAVERRG